MSYEDIKYMEIKNKNLIYLLVIDILVNINNFTNIGSLEYILFIVALISLIAIFPLINKYIGGADIKLFLLLVPLIGKKIIVLILISSLLGLIYSVVNKKQMIPFIPFITIALLILEVNYLIK